MVSGKRARKTMGERGFNKIAQAYLLSTSEPDCLSLIVGILSLLGKLQRKTV